MIYQIDLLLSRAAFDLLFSGDGGTRIISDFVIHQLVNIVLFDKCAAQAILVFIDPARQVVCYTGIKYGMVRIGHDVNTVLVANCHDSLTPSKYVVARSVFVLCDEATSSYMGYPVN
jgi:hypothetical protein